MTNYCKSNVRRVINYTNTEPLNKYDLWLSENLRYNEDGELEYDNNGQPACDLILKIFRNGKWEPIVGYNTTAGNKINVVNGVDYTYTAINHSTTHTNHGFSQNHLPLFRNPQDSPDELFDAGTLGQALNNFVTQNDWQTIIEDGGLGSAITYQFNSGNINIRPAEANRLGGIYATRYQGGYADSNDNATTYLTKCKYKYQAPTDYNLYVHAKEIMQTIHNYTEEHSDDSDFPSIVPPGVVPDDEVPTLLYNWFRNSPSIMKGWQDSSSSSSSSLGGNKPRFEIWGTNSNNAGKILTLQPTSWWEGPHPTGYDPYDINHNAINWMSPEELFGEYSYELPLASLGALGGIRADRHTGLLPGKFVAECKLYNPNHLAQQNSYRREALCVDVRDVKQALDDWYAENDSTEWDLNLKSSYGIVVRKETFTDDDNNQIVSYTHSLSNYGQFTQEGMYCRTKFYNQSTPGVQNRDYSYNDTHGLEWVGAQTIVEEGLGISSGTGYLYYNGGAFVLDPGTEGGGSETTYYPLSQSNYNSSGNYLVGVSGTTGGATRYLNGLGQWTTPPNTTYNDFSGSAHGLVPASTNASQDKYLKGDGTWGIPTVSAEFDIDMDSAAVSDDYDFTLSNMSLTSTNTVSPINKTLREWHYYEINCGDKTTEFTFSYTHVSGNAIYIRINTAAYPVQINTDADLILSNLTMSSSRRQLNANSSYLVTIQFGIIKIEMIASNRSLSENTNS